MESANNNKNKIKTNRSSDRTEIRGFKYSYKPNIRSFYKEKKLKNNTINIEKNKHIDSSITLTENIIVQNKKNYIEERKKQKLTRLSDNEFKKKVELIKIQNNIRLSELYELLNHNETNIEFLLLYFDTLNKQNKNKFIADIKEYYPILPIQICKKFNVNKICSEKDRFFKLYTKICQADETELNQIILDEFKFPEELELFNFSQKEKENISRWGKYYNKIIDFKNIDNEELFYYAISNSILTNFKKALVIREYYHQTLKELYPILEKLYFNKIEDKELFEFVFLFILNGQKGNALPKYQGINLYDSFIYSMRFEINKEILLSEKTMVKEFKNYNIEAVIKENNIYLKKNGNSKIIENYKKYNITKYFVINISYNFFDLESILFNHYKFEYLKNPKNYFEGILYQIIEKYVSSNLSKTAIYKCFSLKSGECPEIENEIFTPNIHKYIRYLPYNSYDDNTCRTMKLFGKIIIEPSKQKMIFSLVNKLTQNIELFECLEKFINIVYRKYIFQHELNHLCKDLLNFFYIHNLDEINAPPKLTKNNKELILNEKEYNEQSKTDKNIEKESREISEKIAYGKIEKIFNLKQLLFIANENNEKLNVDEFKKKYQEEMGDKNATENIFKEFKENNQILSDLVNNIYDEMKKELSLEMNKGKSIDDFAKEILACPNELFKENNRIKSIEDFAELIITEDLGHYDCHIDGRFLK